MHKGKTLKKYKKEMTKVMLRIDPSLDKDNVEDTIDKMIDEMCMNPSVKVENNYTGEERDTTLLSVLDWVMEKDPIIAGNATFYKNQHEAMNPIAAMLKGFLTKRKMFKKQMFAVDNPLAPEYKDFDRKQGNEKINANSYYGASGMKSSAFFSKFSGPATTHTAQQVISTAETLSEGFIADNYLYINLTECIEWCQKVLKEFDVDSNPLDDFICVKSVYEVLDRLIDKVINKEEDDEEILERYLSNLSDEELSVLYYKNNLIQFIDDHDYIKEIFISIFENIDNHIYADENDTFWLKNVVPKELQSKFFDAKAKDWNKYVNKEYFMDPNDIPDTIEGELYRLNEYMFKYVYVRYLSPDRIYRLRNFDRAVVTVIDTDSNILSIDTIIDYLEDNILRGEDFGRPHLNNMFILINTLAYILSQVLNDLLLVYGEYSNVPEEYRPIYNIKNEFLFDRLLIGDTKKRYLSKILLREGNLMDPPKYDVKGFDFKKATCSEFAEDFFMKLLKKHILISGEIDTRTILREIYEFKSKIKESIMNGERTYLPNGNAKELEAYANPYSIQSVRAVHTWNLLNPTNEIELPSKVSLVKLKVFTEEDIAPLKDVEPSIYNTIMDKIFNDELGIYVKKKWISNEVLHVNPRKKEWWKDIPSKYRAKYKALGVDAWNEFADDYENPESDNGKWEIKSTGLDIIAIPSNSTIPEWLLPYVDYNTMINNILSPFIPVLNILKVKTVMEGKSSNNRQTKAITNIIKI